jgi:outer membrane protein assembly factor BamB
MQANSARLGLVMPGMLLGLSFAFADVMLSKAEAEETPQRNSNLASTGLPTKAESASVTGDLEYAKYFGPQQDWPRFRGPTGNGVCHQKGLPTKWNYDTGENIVWSAETFGPDAPYHPWHPYASPIVYKNKVFIVFANYKKSIFVDPPKDLHLKTPFPSTFDGMAEFKLACYQKSDGKKLWETAIEPVEDWPARPTPGEHADECGPVASTPCTDGERVYVVWGPGHGSGEVAAVDFDGKVVWRQDLTRLLGKGTFHYQVCSSPMIYKDTIVLSLPLSFPSGFHTLGLDCKTGAVKYDEKRGSRIELYTSPLPLLVGGKPFILNNTNTEFSVLDPDNGKAIWSVKQVFSSASPTVGDEMIYADACGAGFVGTALSFDSLSDAKGDITGRAKWKIDHKIPGAAGDGDSPVISNGYVYRRCASKLFCIEVKTGNIVYEEKMPDIPTYLSYSNSFVTDDGFLYFANSGRSVVLKTGPKFEVVAVNELKDGSWPVRGNFYAYAHNSAAVSDGRIYIQGHKKLWCIGNK